MKTNDLQIFAEAASAEVSGENSAEVSESSVAEKAAAASDKDIHDDEFEELIRGKYSDAFARRTQGIIDKRFAKFKGYEKTARACEPLLEKLSAAYPDIDASDTERLIEVFLSSGEEKNESPANETVKKEKEVSPVLKTARMMLEKKAARDVAAYFEREQEKLREIYPSFSLEKQLGESEDFRRLLNSGVSLRRAFETVNFEKIMGNALRYAVMTAGKKTADIMKNSSRVSENPLRDTASSVQRTDVNNLTEKEIINILSQVSKGAKIRF